jgi:hypothetical protein
MFSTPFNMTFKTATSGFMLGIALLLSCGCGDGRPSRVPVAGRVLIDGKPLAKAGVRFYPTGGRSSSGKTDIDGRFVLTCYEPNDGALVGNHQVVVAAIEEISGNTVKWHAPKKYAEPTTSGLQANIDGPIDDLKFDLTWSGDRPFLERDGKRVENR